MKPLNKVIINKNTRMSPKDKALKEAIKMLIETAEYSTEEIIERLVKSINDKDKSYQKLARNRIKTLVKNLTTEIYSEDEKIRDLLVQNNDWEMLKETLNFGL